MLIISIFFSPFSVCTPVSSLYLAFLCPSTYGAAFEKMFTICSHCAIIRQWQWTITLSLNKCAPLCYMNQKRLDIHFMKCCASINLPWGCVRSHTKFGPDLFSSLLFIGHKQTNRHPSKVFMDLNLFSPENNWHQSKRLPVLGYWVLHLVSRK